MDPMERKRDNSAYRRKPRVHAKGMPSGAGSVEEKACLIF